MHGGGMFPWTILEHQIFSNSVATLERDEDRLLTQLTVAVLSQLVNVVM